MVIQEKLFIFSTSVHDLDGTTKRMVLKLHSVMDWTVSLSKFLCRNPNLCLETGLGGRSLKLHEIPSLISSSDETDILTRRGKVTRGLIPFTSTEERPREDTANRWPSTSQEETSYQKPNWPAPWPWTSQLLNSENINVCCLNHPACGILLWQPKQTNTEWKRVKEESRLASTYDLKNIHEGIQLSMSQYGICVVRIYTWEYKWHITVCYMSTMTTDI